MPLGRHDFQPSSRCAATECSFRSLPIPNGGPFKHVVVCFWPDPEWEFMGHTHPDTKEATGLEENESIIDFESEVTSWFQPSASLKKVEFHWRLL